MPDLALNLNSPDAFTQAGNQILDITRKSSRDMEDTSAKIKGEVTKLGATDDDYQGKINHAREEYQKNIDQLQNEKPPEMHVRSPMEAFGGAATWLGILGGFLTRHPLVTGLKAASSAMNAYRQGDMETYKSQYENWKLNTDHAIKMAQLQNDQINAIINDKKASIDEITARMNAFAAVNRDTMLSQQIQVNGLEGAVNLMNDRQLFIQRAQEGQLKMVEAKTTLDLMAQVKQSPEYVHASPDIKARMIAEITNPTIMAAEMKLTGSQLSEGAIKEAAKTWKTFGTLPAGISQQDRARILDYAASQKEGGTKAEGASGQDYLGTLEPGVATQVKALAEGRLNFPSGFALRSPYWQQMLQMVSQYDPSFDAVNYNARANTRKDFTSGQAAKNVTSLNTVMGHLEKIKEAGEALSNSSLPAYNAAVNTIRTATGDARVVNFETAKQAVVDELERTFRGTAGSVTGIRNWADKLTPNASPEQMQGAWNTLVDLLDSRIDALGDQYTRGMGVTTDGLTLLAPKAQQAYESIRGRPADLKTRGPTGAVQEPKRIKAGEAGDADYKALPLGALYFDEQDGQTKRKQ